MCNKSAYDLSPYLDKRSWSTGFTLLMNMVLCNILHRLISTHCSSQYSWLVERTQFFLAAHFNFVPPTHLENHMQASVAHLLFNASEFFKSHRHLCSAVSFPDSQRKKGPVISHCTDYFISFSLQEIYVKCADCFLFMILPVVTAWMLIPLSWLWCGVPACVSVKVIINKWL